MLLHVFVSPVCASPIPVTTQRTNSMLKQSLTLCLAAAMTTVAAGVPGVFSFLCRQICSHQWRKPPKRGVHCKPQWQEDVMISWPIKVCTAIIFCLFYLLLPVLHLSPGLRSTEDWVLAKHIGDLESISLPAAILCIWAGWTTWGLSVSGEVNAWEVTPSCRQQSDKFTQENMAWLSPDQFRACHSKRLPGLWGWPSSWGKQLVNPCGLQPSLLR